MKNGSAQPPHMQTPTSPKLNRLSKHFSSNFGVDWQIKETTHPSFIEGRVGKIIVAGSEVGVVGEINPAVLEAWKLENPASAFEINLQRIIDVQTS